MRFSAALVAVCALALDGAAAAAEAPQQTASPSDLRPIARASATEVLLDIAVFDKHGKAIKNLKAGDIDILEDEVSQQITSFRFIPPNQTSPSKAPVSAAAGRPAAAGPRSLRAVNLVCIVFHNLDPVARARAIEVAREFLKHELPPETYIGMFLLDDRLTAIHPFTAGRQELADAAGKAFTLRSIDFARASEPALTANPTQSTIMVVVDNATHTANVTQEVTGGEISKTAIVGAEVSNDIGANTMRGARLTEARDFSHISGMRETDKINNMVTQLGKLPGRKLVLLLSTGFATTGDPELFQSIVNKASESRTTIYAIDVSGLTENSTAQAANLGLGQVAAVSRTQRDMGGSLSAAKEKSRQGDTMNDAIRASDVQASLRALAEGTGGFLVANTNEFQKPFQRIADDLETHYEVTYRPSLMKDDGRLRNIRVKLSHPDWRAESRTGYFAVPSIANWSTPLPYETIGLAVLDSKPLPHAFEVHTAVFQFRASVDSREGALAIEVPGTALAATANPARHSHLLHAQILTLIKDSGGQIVDKFSLDAPYEIADDKVTALRTTPLVYTHAIDLPAGRYTAETLVMDREGSRATVDVLPFELSTEKSPVALSSPLLIRRLEPAGSGAGGTAALTIHGQRLVPFADMSLTADTKPYAYFVVYPDRSIQAKPRLQVEFRVDGRQIADQIVDLPAPDATGAIPMLIRAAVHSGRCELKITAIQGSASASRTLAYNVQ